MKLLVKLRDSSIVLTSSSIYFSILELKQTAFDEYCQEHPEAKELMRGYDPWFCHWQEEEPQVEDNGKVSMTYAD